MNTENKYIDHNDIDIMRELVAKAELLELGHCYPAIPWERLIDPSKHGHVAKYMGMAKEFPTLGLVLSNNSKSCANTIHCSFKIQGSAISIIAMTTYDSTDQGTSIKRETPVSVDQFIELLKICGTISHMVSDYTRDDCCPMYR